MPKCSVKKCKNNTLTTLKKDGISYFRFPKNEIEREKWRKIIANERSEDFFKPNDSSVVCSLHFSENDMYYTKKGFRKINKGVLPCIAIEISTTPFQNVSPGSARNEPSTSTVGDNSEVNILTRQPVPSMTTTTLTLSTSTNKLVTPTDGEKSLVLQSKSEENNAVEAIPRNEQITELDLIRRCPPSPTSSGLTSILDTPKTSYYKKSLRTCQKTIDLKNKEIQNLKKKTKRLMKRNLTLKEIVADLKKKRLVDESLSNDLTKKIDGSNDKVVDILSAKKKVYFAKYPPELRKFALTLHFYSPASYKYVRQVFAQNLPHPNTLFRWYQNVDAQPGFTEEAFLRMADKAKTSSEPLLCSLVVDEMSIRQQKTWTGRKFEGLVDLGIGHDDSDLKATQAFVFVVVSINQSWTLPVAYFFIHSLTGEMKSNMILLTLQKCHDIGVKIVSLTFDGCKTNINCMKALGCNLENKENMKTTFPHPCGGYEVAVFLDACHMVKLMRNLLEAQKCIYDTEDKEIKWDLILALHNLQEENSLHLANKLSVRHIYFRNEVMKIKLASQLLSNSVAKAIEFCDKQLHIEKFADSDATVKFIKMINDLFDILNSRNLTDFGYSTPLNEKNAGKVLELCADAKKYLLSLTMKVIYKKTKTVNRKKRVVYETKKVPLYQCRANTGVIGLLTCINSLIHLYSTLIETKTLSFLTTYKFSQDHIELFFGKIRSLGGHNNNPNTRQFKSAYKKLMTHLELSKKFSGNCLPLESIPILSSGESTAKINNTTTGIRREDEDEENISKTFLDNRRNQEAIEEKYGGNCDHLSERLVSESNNVTDQIVGYISGFVVYHLLKKINCDDCKNHLLATEKEWFHKLVDIKDVGGLLSMASNILANRHDTLGPEVNSLLDYMDMLYAVTAEVHMQRVLNETIAYPNVSKSAEEITEGFLEDVLLDPLKRIRGTTQGKKLLGAIADIITNKRIDLNARRLLKGSDYDFYKINKRGRSSHGYRSYRRRRPKFVITKGYGEVLLSDENGEIQMTTRTEEDRQSIVYRKHKEDSNDFYNFENENSKFISASENTERTAINPLDAIKRRYEIVKHGRHVSKGVNDNEKYFRGSYNSNNNFRQNKMFNNRFRTLLYGKDRKDRFETDYTQVDTTKNAYFQRTRPTTKDTKPTMELPTDEYNNLKYNYDKQPTHGSNIHRKQKLKVDSVKDTNKIKSLLRESIPITQKSNAEEESKDSNSDEEFTTTSKILYKKKPTVTAVTSSQFFTKPSKNIYKNTSETKKDRETTKSEFKEANISLKHFYFKPVLIQNKSGDSNEFVSIEFDGEPNLIDFSMKVKLKKPRTQPTAAKATEKLKNTATSETTVSPTTTALRVLNPYKMDNYFKNKNIEHDAKNVTADNEDSSSDDSDPSSSDHMAESGLSIEEEKDRTLQVFGKLHKIRNHVDKKHNLRSKKHDNAKKHHHKIKHEKHKRHKTNHGKHGKKHKHKYLLAYLKKKNHARKKRLKHKLKQLIDKRIIGKNFEIAFDASFGDSNEKNLIDVTIVKRARDGKRATISLVNKDQKSRSSDSSFTSEEDNKNATTGKEHISSMSSKAEHKIKRVKTSTLATTLVATEGIFNLGNHNEVEGSKKHDPEAARVNNDNSHQVTNKDQPSAKRNEETAQMKDSRKNKRVNPNENRKRKKLPPMLIQVNKSNFANNRGNARSFRQMKNNVGPVHRRFLPIQVFNDSVYSDEEDDLKNNLYDAFRHKDEVYYRRNMRHDLPLKDELKEESDITEEEIVLKQNIYKAIKGGNRKSFP